MGGAGSYLSILCVIGFLSAAWFGSKASKFVEIPSIVLEITVGIVLGPDVLCLVPADYSVCRAKQYYTCELPENYMFRLQNDNVLDDGVGVVYTQGLCPKEHYSQQFSKAEGEAVAGHRRLSAAAPYRTIEECLKMSCTSMVSRQCLLAPAFLTIVGHAGVALMIFERSMQFDFEKVGRVAARSAVVAVLGALCPLISGALLMLAYGRPLVPDGFAVGTALSPTSIGIALRLLTEVGGVHEDVGQATATATFFIDIISLILLTVLLSLNGEFDAMATVGKPIIGIAFLVITLWASVKIWPKVINEWILPRVPERPDSKVSRKDEVLFFIMFCVLILDVAITFFLGTHLWGCLIAGVTFTCLGKDGHAHRVWVRQTKRITTWMIRVFFSAAIGFSIPIHKLLSPEAFWKGSVMGIGPCIIAKFVCAPHMGDAKWVVGSAMVGRAEFAYIIAHMAVSADLIDSDTYSIVIWALLYATIFSPLLFRKLLSRYMGKYRVAEAVELEEGAVVPTSDALAAVKTKDVIDVHVDVCSVADQLQAMVDVYADGGSLAGEVRDTAGVEEMRAGDVHVAAAGPLQCGHRATTRADVNVVGDVVSALKSKEVARKLKSVGFKDSADVVVVGDMGALKLKDVLHVDDIALKAADGAVVGDMGALKLNDALKVKAFALKVKADG